MSDKAIASKRSQKRARVLLKAVVKIDDWETEVRIRDLSTLGALLEGDRRPALGKEVNLVRGELDARCNVTWIDGDRFGVQFLEPISPSEVLTHIGTPMRVSAPQSYRRPRMIGEQVRGHDLQLVERWAQLSSAEAFGE